MTDTNEAAFWTSARPAADRGWMAKGRANVNAYYEAHQPAPEPAPVSPDSDAVAGLSIGSMAEYAAARDQLIGIRPSSEFVGLDGVHLSDAASGFPSVADTSFNSAAELMAATNPYRRWERPGEAPRERGIPASLVESQDGQHRGRGTVNPR